MSLRSCAVVASGLLAFGSQALAAETDARLAEAAQREDRAAIRTLLKQPAGVNAPQADGMTALHWAAYFDDLETAKLLVAANANASARCTASSGRPVRQPSWKSCTSCVRP